MSLTMEQSESLLRYIRLHYKPLNKETKIIEPVESSMDFNSLYKKFGNEFTDRRKRELDLHLKEKKKKSWYDTIKDYIDAKGFNKDSDFYNSVQISRQTYHDMREPEYHPKKPIALKVVVGLRLNVEEAEDLLNIAGYSFSNSSKTDIIVKWFLEQEIYDFSSLNDYLFELGEKTL